MTLRAPFPWFGGKSRAAGLVWPRFGDVANYIEPFAGSLAVLLARPDAFPPRVETVNDKDAYLANFWRAVQKDPDHVAFYADWPVNETDLHARHRWLVETARARVEKLTTNPDYFDAKIAGWWVYGQCLWIGSGWCAEPGPNGGKAYLKARVKAGRAARGINASRISGNEIWQKRPKLSDGGFGGWVHRDFAGDLPRKRPSCNGNGNSGGSGGLYAYMNELAARLRRVRVCCGDWKRVITPAVTTYIGLTGVLLDPPYQQDLRERCYTHDENISAAVRAWALEHGDDPKMRIALCGYEDEHGPHMPSSWSVTAWKAGGGYGRTDRGKANRHAERIWFSPHSLADQRHPLLTESEASA